MSDTQISTDEVEEAYRTILKYVGEDITREGILDTPKRVRKALDEWFGGYKLDPKEILSTEFSETDGYNEIILLKDIEFHSHCEHHMCPIIGKAHVAYIPNEKVVGISKLARLVDCFSRRFTIQERMTQQIGNSLKEKLNPQGIMVLVEADHMCISTRGIKKSESKMTTSYTSGCFAHYDTPYRNEFYNLIRR